MKELRISDADLQAIIGPPLRAFLREAGFRMGTASDDHAGFFFPINLNLSGVCTLTRGEDGIWTFTQQTDLALAERTAVCTPMLIEAIMTKGAGN